MSASERDLNPGEWAVLTLCDEGPTHGFALAQELAPDGPVGRVWSVRRPLVYRALQRLVGLGLVDELGPEQSPTGPPRIRVAGTAAARERVDGWLEEPVEHVRDGRYLLLLKLLFLDRRGRPSDALVDAQTKVYASIEERLRTRLPEAEGFDRVLMSWRLQSARAALTFLDEV
ncbi:MAG TPA: PadR family transcriptional regulator [Baekduia sp.]